LAIKSLHKNMRKTNTNFCRPSSFFLDQAVQAGWVAIDRKTHELLPTKAGLRAIGRPDALPRNIVVLDQVDYIVGERVQGQVARGTEVTFSPRSELRAHMQEVAVIPTRDLPHPLDAVSSFLFFVQVNLSGYTHGAQSTASSGAPWAEAPEPTNLGGLSFQFSDATFAPLFYANVGQVNAQIPWELEGQSQTTITATINGQTSAPQTVSLATYAPGILALNSEGTGPGAILDANYHLVDASNPAIPGQTTILIYCTGLGPVSSNQPATGAPASLTNLAHTSSPVTATIGGVSANVTFSGLAPAYVGLYQVNVQVPAGLAANSSAPVMISIEGANSNTVTIAVQ
jgi:uncharacterized protein (TIGR03437 family)